MVPLTTDIFGGRGCDPIHPYQLLQLLEFSSFVHSANPNRAPTLPFSFNYDISCSNKSPQMELGPPHLVPCMDHTGSYPTDSIVPFSTIRW